jgi:hypothetical protein
MEDLVQIQVNTDNTIEGREALATRTEAEIRSGIGRFAAQVTRIEVHFGDVNADKSGGDDKRCMLEARLAGRQPEAVTHEAATVDAALSGALKKLRRLLESSVGRLNDHKGAESIRTGG